MLIAWSGWSVRTAAAGCSTCRTSERQQLRRSFPDLVIECVPVSKMKLCSY